MLWPGSFGHRRHRTEIVKFDIFGSGELHAAVLSDSRITASASRNLAAVIYVCYTCESFLYTPGTPSSWRYPPEDTTIAQTRPPRDAKAHYTSLLVTTFGVVTEHTFSEGSSCLSFACSRRTIALPELSPTQDYQKRQTSCNSSEPRRHQGATRHLRNTEGSRCLASVSASDVRIATLCCSIYQCRRNLRVHNQDIDPTARHLCYVLCRRRMLLRLHRRCTAFVSCR